MQTFSVSEATYVESCRLFARRSTLRTLVGTAIPALAVLLVFVVFLHESITTALLAAGGTAVGIAFGMFAVDRSLIPWRARRLYRQHKGLHETIEFSWNPEAVSLRAASGASSTPWSHYRRCREGNSVFLLYLTDSMYHVIPKAAFQSEAELAEFRKQCSRVHT
jgi:hypothetical protein